MLAMTILVSPITDTSAATNTHFAESWPSQSIFTPTTSVVTARMMMTPIPIDAGTIDLRQNASAEYRLAAASGRRRRWSGRTFVTFVPEDVLCPTARRGASATTESVAGGPTPGAPPGEKVKNSLPPRAIKSRQDAVPDASGWSFMTEDRR